MATHHDVLRLDIAVNDAHLVGVLERLADLDHDGDRRILRHGSALLDPGREVITEQQLHHDERNPLVFRRKDGAHDVRVS